MHSFYEIFPDCGALEGLFFSRGRVLIYERIEIFFWGGGVESGEFFFLKVKG